MEMLKKTRRLLKNNLLGVIQVLGGLYIGGFILVGVSNMFGLMGEVWGYFSIVWFAALGGYTFYENLYRKDGKTAADMIDDLLVVVMKFAVIVGLTLGAGVLGEYIRIVLSPMIGWLVFLAANICIFRSNVSKHIRNI